MAFGLAYCTAVMQMVFGTFSEFCFLNMEDVLVPNEPGAFM